VVHLKVVTKPVPDRVDDFIAPSCNDDIEILFQDESILLINKPSGLLSLSGKNLLNKDSVHFRLVQLFSSVTMVHRLDFGTSGLMVLALKKAVNGNLTRQFQARTVEKTYTALLQGHMSYNCFSDGCGKIDLPIAKDPPNFPLMKICHKAGKAAVSQFEVLEYLDEPFASRVLFMPLTGRTHQLRLHSREIGHSILGDDLYGVKEQDEAKRLMLHATTLAFDHPVTGERLEWECPAPF